MSPTERANSHVARGEWKEAAQSFREAVAAAPGDAGTHVGLGFALMQLGENAPARDALDAAVTLDPASFDAHYLLGQLARGAGDTNAAVAHFREAIRHKPSFVEAHRDLVTTLLQTDAREAMKAAMHAVEAFPEDAEFWFYRGAASEQAGHPERAIAIYQRACELRPDALPARKNLAHLLAKDKRYADALPHCDAWTALAPDDPDAFMMLGTAQFETANVEAAIASYRRSLALRPHAGIEYILASLTGKSLDRAPDAYVAQLFDGYASNFDSHLVGTLKYSTPKQLAGILPLDGARKIRDVLDLGCGTGLMGVELTGIASNMVGVDLSEKMLDKARERNLYKKLVKADLVAMMAGEPDSQYDLVVAADVFVYVGKLDALFEHAFRLLRPSGWFAFSVEAATPDTARATAEIGYALHDQGRYVHTKDYIQRLAMRAGFDTIAFRDAVCRENLGVPVPAYLAAYRRP